MAAGPVDDDASSRRLAPADSVDGEAALDAFLAEDIGDEDVTTVALADEAAAVTAEAVARDPCVVAGVAEAAALFRRRGAKVDVLVEDGARVDAGTPLLRVEGPARVVLTVERVALNLLMRMSGIASLTRRLQDMVDAVNPRCKVAATRKTTPGFRAFEKKAVALGGGEPHRPRLESAFLVKDNHLALGLTVAEAVGRCRAHRPDLVVEVEADTVDQALAAARAGADEVLLDNMPPAQAEDAAGAVREVNPRIVVEVSGGITEELVPRYAAFADRISMGRLTMGAGAVDVGLDVRP